MFGDVQGPIGLAMLGMATMLLGISAEVAAETAGTVAAGDLDAALLDRARQAAVDALRTAGQEADVVALDEDAIGSLRRCVGEGIRDACQGVFLSSGQRAHWLFLDATREVDIDGSPQHVVTGWWLDRSGAVLSGDRRYCPRCTPEQLSASVRELVTALLEPRAGGLRTALVIRSSPAGAVVAVDRRTIGVTGVEYVVRPGSHRVRIEREGYRAEERQVTVAQGATTTIDVSLSPDTSASPHDDGTGRAGRRIAGWALAGGGAGLMATGAAFFFLDQPEIEGGGRQAEHRDSSAWGLAMGAAGLCATGVGVWLLLADGGDSRAGIAAGPASTGGLWVRAGMQF